MRLLEHDFGAENTIHFFGTVLDWKSAGQLA